MYQHQCAYKFNVYRKNIKIHSPSTSKSPKSYKQSKINGGLCRSKRVSSNFNQEIPLVGCHPLRFINGVVNDFQKDKECADESFIKPFISTEIPYFELSEIKSKPEADLELRQHPRWSSL